MKRSYVKIGVVLKLKKVFTVSGKKVIIKSIDAMLRTKSIKITNILILHKVVTRDNVVVVHFIVHFILRNHLNVFSTLEKWRNSFNIIQKNINNKYIFIN